MLVFAFIIALGLLTVFFDRWLDNQNNPNRQPAEFLTAEGVHEGVLKRNKQGHYVVSGTINQLAVRFLLDTGATDVVIPERLARQADLQYLHSQQAGTANGVIIVYATVIASLQVGNIILRNVRASINPSMGGETILLGMSALKQIEFSQRGDTLTLRQYP